MTAQKLHTDNVSGSTRVTGSIGEADMGSVSGGLTLAPGANLNKADLESVSGSATIELPENDGFSVRHSSVSGGFNCDFETSTSKNSAVYKNGGADIDVETVSGGIKVVRADG